VRKKLTKTGGGHLTPAQTEGGAHARRKSRNVESERGYGLTAKETKRKGNQGEHLCRKVEGPREELVCAKETNSAVNCGKCGFSQFNGGHLFGGGSSVKRVSGNLRTQRDNALEGGGGVCLVGIMRGYQKARDGSWRQNLKKQGEGDAGGSSGGARRGKKTSQRGKEPVPGSPRLGGPKTNKGKKTQTRGGSEVEITEKSNYRVRQNDWAWKYATSHQYEKKKKPFARAPAEGNSIGAHPVAVVRTSLPGGGVGGFRGRVERGPQSERNGPGEGHRTRDEEGRMGENPYTRGGGGGKKKRGLRKTGRGGAKKTKPCGKISP